jgi:hypothetical protein
MNEYLIGWGLLIFPIVAICIAFLISDKIEKKKQSHMTLEEKREYFAETQRKAKEYSEQISKLPNQYGYVNIPMICPHCHTKASVRTKPITQKKGVSGGKATAAVVTGGLSILAVGLSRKETFTQAHCDNCNSTWLF